MHPSHREDPGRRVLFREYAVSYFDSYHKKDGTKLCGRSKLIVKDALDKLMPHFGDMEVSRITKAEVDKWYATASKQYKPGVFEHACNSSSASSRPPASPRTTTPRRSSRRTHATSPPCASRAPAATRPR